MTALVIDASVAVKWLVDEPGTDAAIALLDEELHAPDLIYSEVANILWKKQVRGEVDPDIAAYSAEALTHVQMRVEPCALLAVDAVTLSVRLGHPAYDCFYLALARRVGAMLVTADKRLVARCQQGDVPEIGSVVRLLAASGH